MSSPTHLKHITAWLSDLANLTAGTAPLADAKLKIGSSASLLADEFPNPATFCRDSLAFVARQQTFFPAFADLRRLIEQWWSENRPRTPALLGPDGLGSSGLSPQDKALVRTWYNNLSDKPTDQQAAVSLSSMRQISRAAFHWLIEHDTGCASIAVRHGWGVEPPARREPHTEAEIAEIEAASQRIRGAIAEATSALHAHPPVYPPGDASTSEAMRETAAAYARLGPPPQPLPLSRDQLTTAYAAHPGIPNPRASPANDRHPSPATQPASSLWC